MVNEGTWESIHKESSVTAGASRDKDGIRERRAAGCASYLGALDGRKASGDPSS